MYKELLRKHEELFKNEEPSSEITHDEAKKMLKELILEKSQECDSINEDMFEELFKGAFTRGLSILGTLGILATGAQDMGKKPVEPIRTSPQETKKIQQEAYNQARQEGDEIIGKYQENSKKENRDSFLKAIAMNESSGGKNTNHAEMKSGIHAGTSALGTYGLMPNTIREMANRMDGDHPMKMYAGMENHQISQSMKKNPGHEGEVAKFMADHLHEKFGGDEDKMAYSWFNGHNLTDKHFATSHKDYQNHDYVKKYQKHKSQLVNKQPISPESSVASNK